MNGTLIVLDTNIIQEDFLMKSARMEILFNYAERTEATFLLPRIVHDELFANYERHVRGRIAKLIRSRQHLNGLLIDRTEEIIDFDVSSAVNDYKRHVLTMLGVTPDKILEYRENYLQDALTRAIHRRPPCSDRGEEIRDAILWQSVLDAAATLACPILFISNNIKQFAIDRENLHPELAKEAADRGVRLSYFASVEDFARKHATRIAFITREWLQEQIDGDSLIDAAREEIVEASFAEPRFGRYFGEEFEDVEGISAYIDVDDFFIYDMGGEEFRVEASWYGHAEVEHTTRVKSLGSNSGDWLDDHWHRERRNIDVRFEVRTSIVVKDARVVKYSVAHKWAERD